MANFGAAFGQGFQGATQAQGTLQKLQDQQDQQNANAMLAKVLQQYSQSQQQQAPAQPPQAVMPANFQGPMPQGMPPRPAMPPSGGVSPQGGGIAPAAGAPGGAGLNPMGSAPAQSGIDLQRLVQAIMAQKGSGGAQGYALQDSMKLLQPQANNALKIDLAGQKGNLAEDLQVKRLQAQRDLTAYRANVESASTKDLDRELASTGNALRSALAGTDEYNDLKGKYDTVWNEIQTRRAKNGLPKKEANVPAGKADSAQAPAGAIQPGEPTATDVDGNILVVRDGQWVKAGGK